MGNCQTAEGSNSPINHTLMRKTKKSTQSSSLKLLGHVTTEENSRSKVLLFIWGLQHSSEDPARSTGCEDGRGPGGHRSDVPHCVTQPDQQLVLLPEPEVHARALWHGQSLLRWDRAQHWDIFWPTDTQMVLVAASGRQGCSNPVHKKANTGYSIIPKSTMEGWLRP